MAHVLPVHSSATTFPPAYNLLRTKSIVSKKTATMAIQMLLAGMAMSGMTIAITPTTINSTENTMTPFERAYQLNELPKASTTGEWLASAVRFLNDGDHLDGEALRRFMKAEGLDEEGREVEELINSIDFFEVKKSNSDKIRLELHLKEEKNIKRKFIADGEQVRLTLKHKTSTVIIKRLNSNSVELGFRGIGAFYAGKPIPERMMDVTIKKDKVDNIELAGFDVDGGQRLDLPAELRADN
jgi:hypothetical protein